MMPLGNYEKNKHLSEGADVENVSADLKILESF